jgi:hypothetical protein
LNGLQIVNGDVNAPGAKACATTCCVTWAKFSSAAASARLGHIFAFIVSIVFGSSALREQHRDCRSYRDPIPHVA